MATVYKSGSTNRPQTGPVSSSVSTPVSSATSSATPSTSLAGFNLQDLADEGRGQIENARQQANDLLAAAQADADRIREEAKQQGYEAGLQLATTNADVKLQAVAEQRAQSGIEMIQSLLDQLREIHEQWMVQYASSLHTIALSAAERIVGHELSCDPQLIVAWADQAVRSTRAASRLTVAVHPETLALLGQSLDEMLAAPDLPEDTCVEPDASLELTEVAVRQSGGQINAGLTTQLRRLEELLS